MLFITEETWEPKSNIKNLDLMLKKFEHEYPYSIDKEMYYIIYIIQNQKKEQKEVKKLKKTKKFKMKKNFC